MTLYPTGAGATAVGVLQIVAGTGISISPLGGTGVVTVSASSIALVTSVEAVVGAVLLHSNSAKNAWNVTLTPKADATYGLGSTALRVHGVFTDSTGHAVYAAQSDANPSALLDNTAIHFGAGGASAIDATLGRVGVGQLGPLGDGAVAIGIPSKRVNGFVSNNTGFKVYNTVSDAQPTSELLSDRIAFGAGGSSAVDSYIRRWATSQLQVTGKLYAEIPTYSPTTPYTVGAYDEVELISTGNSAFALALPASPASGRKVLVIKTDAGSGAITVTPNSSDTIEGAATAVISSRYGKLGLVCDGGSPATWYDLGSGGV